MYSVIVRTHFWASHSVLMPDGSLEPQHSHNFSVEVKVSSEQLNESNMVMDFLDLQKPLEDTAQALSGKVLGQIGYFQTKGQAAEIIAEYFFEIVEKELTDNVVLNSVRVQESPGCFAEFSE